MAVSRVVHILMRSCNGGRTSSTTEVKVNLHNCKCIIHNVYNVHCKYLKSTKGYLFLLSYALTLNYRFWCGMQPT